MDKSIIPGPDNTRALRDAFGRFATGVTVVTIASARGPLGITVNSFASVSLDPPLVLWSPAKSSQRHDALVAAEHFALHVMGEDQDAITRGFSRSGATFDLCEWAPSEHGVPLIEGCPARFECTIRDRIDAGDHTVIIGRVTRASTASAAPRIFLGGRYGSFTPQT